MPRPRRRLLVLLAVLCVVAGQAAADLPVHCLHMQVEGKWEFHMTEPKYDASQHCGHHVPDQNMDHLLNDYVYKQYDWAQKRVVTLSFPNVAVDDNGQRGTWTMIYDEGFEVILGQERFFAFSKYVPRSKDDTSSESVSDYISVCHETLIGWYHDSSRLHWGCYYGKKIEDLQSQDQAQFKDSKRGTVVSVNPGPAPHEIFEPDYSFVEAHNSNGNKLWTASVHSGFLGQRLQILMKLVGRSQYTKNRDAVSAVRDDRPDHEKYEGLPENWDWRNMDGVNYDSPLRVQGACGSCYAFAALSVMESRIRIKTKNRLRPILSAQSVVSCSEYNQGCEGGYPELVGRHVFEFGVVEDSCFPYEAADVSCGRQCATPSRIFRAENYTYIGGYYGACNEVDMMREIYQRGPIVVALMAPPDLFYYSGGIFTGPRPESEGPRLKGLNEWEKTNHATVAVGYGVDKATGDKFWIVKNTWGKAWGEGGYFRIRRGTDECGIESMSSKLDPIIDGY